MKSPYTGKEMSLMREERKLTFRKDEFTVVYHYYFCKDSKEHFETDELSEINIKQVHNKYREKHRLPFPDEIKSIRAKYAISARKMSEILGFGINSYSNYENGDIPEITNGRMIQIAGDPKQFRELALKCGKLDNKLEQKIYSLENENDRCNSLWNFLFNETPTIRNGYKIPSEQKVLMAIRFFAEKLEPWKTKMNKLLFYADFLSFRQHGESITGLKYKAITYGPVPDNYEFLYGMASIERYVEVKEMANNDFSGEYFVSLEKDIAYEDIFSEKELDILNTVVKKFRKVTANEIKEISHREPAWIDNHKSNSLIDYSYSYKLVNI